MVVTSNLIDAELVGHFNQVPHMGDRILSRLYGLEAVGGLEAARAPARSPPAT